MNKIKKPTAFSLIELSIVILIIGIIVASIIGGKKLVTLSSLTKARQLTNSSPVAGIEDLSLWLEATSKSIFTVSGAIVSTPSDGATVTLWNDINPQQTVKYNATSATSPTYLANGINGIPALNFDGTDSMSGAVPIAGTAATVFIVAKRSVAVNNSSTFATCNTAASDTAANAFAAANEGASAAVLQTSNNATTYSSATNPGNNFPYIFVSRFDGAFNTVYLNGAAQTAVAATPTLGTNIYIVGGRCTTGAAATFYNGVIGEIIVYSRSLSDFERNQIEAYLSKKWAIKLT